MVCVRAACFPDDALPGPSESVRVELRVHGDARGRSVHRCPGARPVDAAAWHAFHRWVADVAEGAGLCFDQAWSHRHVRARTMECRLEQVADSTAELITALDLQHLPLAEEHERPCATASLAWHAVRASLDSLVHFLCLLRRGHTQLRALPFELWARVVYHVFDGAVVAFGYDTQHAGALRLALVRRPFRDWADASWVRMLCDAVDGRTAMRLRALGACAGRNAVGDPDDREVQGVPFRRRRWRLSVARRGADDASMSVSITSVVHLDTS